MICKWQCMIRSIFHNKCTLYKQLSALFLTLLGFIPALPTGKTSTAVKKGANLSISEQIASVVQQPAFIAGLSVAAWLVLMGFSGWFYCRHHRRKQLGHYTTSFAYTPAGKQEKALTTILSRFLASWQVFKVFHGKYHHMKVNFWNVTFSGLLGVLYSTKCSLKNQILKADTFCYILSIIPVCEKVKLLLNSYFLSNKGFLTKFLKDSGGYLWQR